MKEAKRKNDERLLEEHKAEEEVRQKLKEDTDKKKRAGGNAEECSKIKEIFRRKQKDVWTRREKAWWLVQRMLDQAATSLTEAIGEGDMLGVRVASELVNSSIQKVDEAVLMRNQHVKDRNELGKNTKKYHPNLCSCLWRNQGDKFHFFIRMSWVSIRYEVLC